MIQDDIVLMGIPTANEQCFNVTLLRDMLVEPIELFAVELESNDTALLVTQTSAQVVLQDNTSEYIGDYSETFGEQPPYKTQGDNLG